MPTQVQLLPEDDSFAFDEYLDSFEEIPYLLSESVIAGSLGMRADVLQRAAEIAKTFRGVCRALHAEMQSSADLREALLTPLTPIPATRDRAASAPFCLQFLRMDFFLERGEELKIIEVNSGGAGLTDYLRCKRWLTKHHSFAPPEGFAELEVQEMLHAITSYAKAHKPDLRSIGFVAVENKCEDQLMEYVEYARWIREHTDLSPHLFSLTDGALAPLSHTDVPSIGLADLDAMYVDWFENLKLLEKAEADLARHNVLRIPAHSDLLFENKNFLSLLQTIDRPRAVAESDWQALQDALIPSFPAQELDNHMEEIKTWPGVVLKMDIDCASENVFLFDFSKMNISDVIEKINETTCNLQLVTYNSTWTIQKLIHPPRLPMAKPTPEWIDYSYEPYKFDLMTYLCTLNGKPHVLFGSRQFSTEKVDDLTEEGRNDNIFSVVSTL